MFYNKQETFNTISHALGAVLALIGSVFLLINSFSDLKVFFIALLYSICMLAMFSASAIYHSQKGDNYEKLLARKIDHAAIYLMIAGSYTIISYLFLPKLYYIPMIIIEWIVAIAGVYLKLSKKIKKKNIWDTTMYIIMGWLAVLALPYMLNNLGFVKIMLLFFGGIAYTVGAIMSYYKKPILIPGVIEGHEFFHIFIIIGAALHYILISSGI
ncbi:MAG: PAQR family membrane homeostasis protein TrhA [Candidatus Heimdallarchaeaceae archaeon]